MNEKRFKMERDQSLLITFSNFIGYTTSAAVTTTTTQQNCFYHHTTTTLLRVETILKASTAIHLTM